tara:strand:- start:4595 stop:5275 length:681 start_codon:yes stop_codon:yes gene_type:complete
LRNIAIIIARKNSKRLRGKNNLKINGVSLIIRAINSVIKSKIFDIIILSTDDPKILKLKNKFKKIKFIKRKKSLAKDNTKAISVVLDIIKNYKSYLSVSLFLPTCPFRDSTDIKKAFKIFKKNYKTTISVTNYEFPPEFAIIRNGKNFSPIPNSPLLKNKTRSQDFSNYMRPNGAIYISLIKNLLKKKNFYSKKMNVYKMSRIKSIDIDTNIDYELAKIISKNYEK